MTDSEHTPTSEGGATPVPEVATSAAPQAQTPQTAAPTPPVAKYCTGCGNGVVATATVCPNCGTPVGSPIEAKSKTTAILLAVFLGAWTWVYTYKRDAAKWWIAFGVSIVTGLIALPVFWIWAIVDSAVKTDAYYEQFPNGQ
jgi:hypothetical protein